MARCQWRHGFEKDQIVGWNESFSVLELADAGRMECYQAENARKLTIGRMIPTLTSSVTHERRI